MKRKRRQGSAAAEAEEEKSEIEEGTAEAPTEPKSTGSKEKTSKKATKKKGSGKDEEDDEEDDEDGDELNVEFDFSDPSELDYHSVRDLLKSGTWEFVDINFSELADTVVNQGNIGTLIKSSSSASSASASDVDETVCALLTTLNVRQFPEQSWPKMISDALVEKARKHADAGVADKLQALFKRSDGKSEVGLLFSERFVNLPLDLLPAFHRALQDDIEWSCTTPECPEEERPFYKFTHFVGVARCHIEEGVPAEGAPQAAAGPKGKKKRRLAASGASGAVGGAAAASADGPKGLVLDRPEDQVYVQKSLWHFSFPVSASRAPGKSAGGGAAARRPERRMVFVITRKAFEQAVAHIPEALAALS